MKRKREREREKESLEKVYDGQTGGTWCLNQRHAIIFDSSACIQHVCSVCLFVVFPVCVGLAEHVNMNRLSTCAVLSSRQNVPSNQSSALVRPGKGTVISIHCTGIRARGQSWHRHVQGVNPKNKVQNLPALVKRRKNAEIRQGHVCLCACVGVKDCKHISVIGRRDNICLQKIRRPESA